MRPCWLTHGGSRKGEFSYLGRALCGVLLFQQEMWVLGGNCPYSTMHCVDLGPEKCQLDGVLSFNSVSSSTDNSYMTPGMGRSTWMLLCSNLVTVDSGYPENTQSVFPVTLLIPKVQACLQQVLTQTFLFFFLLTTLSSKNAYKFLTSPSIIQVAPFRYG